MKKDTGKQKKDVTVMDDNLVEEIGRAVEEYDVA